MSLKVENDNELVNHGRAMGNTFRQILQALGEASLGEQVFYVSPTKQTTEHAFHMAEDMAAPHAKIYISNRRIEFVNYGVLHFVTVEYNTKRREYDDNWSRGYSGIVHYDHWVPE